MRAPLRFALTPLVAALAVGLSVGLLPAGCKKSAPPPPPKPGPPAGGMAGEADPGEGRGKGGMAPHGPGGPSPADIRKQHAKLQGTKATFEKPVPKAAGPNGRTVAEIYAQREALKGKPVAVRGKVVKFNRNILGQNWLHLQDGSGATDDFDLTVTTKAEAKVGDLVLVEGTLATNKSFGAGYSYKVILEQAKVTEEK